MKKFIFACAIIFAPGTAVFCQEAAPADTGAVSTPGQPGTATDTGTGLIRPQEAAPADTGGMAVPPIQQTPSTTTDGAAVAAPPDTSRPADTTAIPPATLPEPREAAPADTTTPRQETPPVETPAAEPEGEEEEEGEAKAERPPNRLALGLVFNDEAPAAMRAWFNPKVGLDVGLGINLRQVEDERVDPPHPESTTTFLNLSFDLGIPIRVLRRAKVDFIVRPGFGFRTRPGFAFSINDPNVRSVETNLELEINGSVGFEYYPFEKASFGLFTGIAVVQTRPGGVGSTTLRVESLPKEAVNFTFRYYIF